MSLSQRCGLMVFFFFQCNWKFLCTRAHQNLPVYRHLWAILLMFKLHESSFIAHFDRLWVNILAWCLTYFHLMKSVVSLHGECGPYHCLLKFFGFFFFFLPNCQTLNNVSASHLPPVPQSWTRLKNNPGMTSVPMWFSLCLFLDSAAISSNIHV